MGPALLALFTALSFSLFAEISALYLTWFSDPTTTMTIQWHTPDDEPNDTVYVEKEDGKWHPIEGSHQSLNYLYIHVAHLAALHPDTEYRFRIGDDSPIYKFRTAPAHLDHPLRFVVGGDVFQSIKLFRRMNQTVVKQNPLFAVIGGDIAYATSWNPFRLRSSAFNRWISFLSEWKNQMVAEDGRLIPFLLAPGNHDIAPDNYELFFTLFAFPQYQLYRAIDFGDYFSLVLLDTGHFQPIEGRQTLWLNQTLAARTHFPYRFAVYHEAAYPSFYPYHGSTPKKIRTYWCPLFEKYRLSLAFENHNHTFKRTHRLKGNRIDAEGILYLGDGCWGARPRKTNDMWYLEKRARKNNIYVVDLTAREAKVEAIDLFGEVLDSTTLSPEVR